MINAEFFEEIETARIQNKINFLDNAWYKKAEDYGKTLDNAVAKEKFYKQLLKYLQNLEVGLKVKLPSIGLTYFKIANFQLLSDASYSTILKNLTLSYKNDKEWDKERRKANPKHLHAEDMAAFRVMQIIKILLSYIKNDKSVGKHISPFLTNAQTKLSINSSLLKIFNESLNYPIIGALSWEPFDKLLGQTPYRAQVVQNYDAATILCEQLEFIHRKGNLSQYGIANAIITMCGATVEGILSNMKYLKVKIKKREPTLGSYCYKYIKLRKPKPNFIVQLLILLSIRNQIHPKNKFNKHIVVDMVVARYIVRLTENIIKSLAKSSRKRAYKKLYT